MIVSFRRFVVSSCRVSSVARLYACFLFSVCVFRVAHSHARRGVKGYERCRQWTEHAASRHGPDICFSGEKCDKEPSPPERLHGTYVSFMREISTRNASRSGSVIKNVTASNSILSYYLTINRYISPARLPVARRCLQRASPSDELVFTGRS